MSRHLSDKLTVRQAQVLDIVIMHIKSKGFPPSLREVGDQLGIGSTNGVEDHLISIERKGYIRKMFGVSRGIEILRFSNGDPAITTVIPRGKTLEAAVKEVRG